MKNIFKLMIAAIALSMVVGCAEKVPPGHKGKILGVNGYNAELLGEGRHTVWGRDSLVLLDLTTNRRSLPLKVTMNDFDADGKPRPGLGMDFVLQFRYRLRDNEKVINTMFHDLKIDPQAGVTAKAVYGMYANAIVETAFRDVLSQFTPEGALANRATVNQKVGAEIQKRLKSNPIEASDIVVTKMVLPKVISDRLIANKNKELELAEEEAKQAIALTKRTNGIALARKDAERDFIDAQSASAQNKELNKGLSDKVLELRRLRIAEIYANAFGERIANGAQGDTVIMPYEAMSSNAGQMRAFNIK